ncbi:MAG: MBL fold metallo-hydrolase, partial [Chryseolinea sp.]
MNISVQFLGAAGTVTGSRYLLQIGNFRLLFDCGLFQGLKNLRLRNWDPFPVPADSINAIIISHAHIDHTGYLPRLVKEGFKGKIYCTKPTADLLEIMLLDSAKLQEEEAAYASKKGYSKHSPPQPLYRVEDAESVMHLVESLDLNDTFTLSDHIQFTFRGAGHLLGAAITELLVKGEAQQKTIVFSGDLGRSSDIMLYPPESINQADVLFIESTYGNKSNPATDVSIELEKIINETFKNQGVVL